MLLAALIKKSVAPSCLRAMAVKSLKGWVLISKGPGQLCFIVYTNDFVFKGLGLEVTLTGAVHFSVISVTSAVLGL